jgi:hypothetical protein
MAAILALARDALDVSGEPAGPLAQRRQDVHHEEDRSD